MRPTFNLVDEPWIPCLLPDNRPQEYGLYEVLTRSHEIKEVFDPSPLVVIALHRLLLAILHRNFGPESLSAWEKLWQRGRWDKGKLRTYFHQWRHRFDLFHPERPFYQVPKMESAHEHPAHLLSLEAAAGNNPTLFDHSHSMAPGAFTPARAARYLLARQAYSIGFGKSKPFYFKDSPLIRGYSILTLGNSLWETLALNMVAYNKERPIPHSGEDLPIWEKEHLPDPDENGNPIMGYVDYLTWQSRAIHLLPEGNPPVIRCCQLQQNWMLSKLTPLDPFKAYIADKEEGWRPRGMIPDRAVWRDCHILFQVGDQSRSRPQVLEWAGRIWGLKKAGDISGQETYGFLAVGLATDIGKAANILLWRQERLPLPLAYLDDMDLMAKLRDALHLAEEVNGILELYLKVVGLTILDPQVDAQRHLRDIAAHVFQREVYKRLSAALFSPEMKGVLKAWAPNRLYFSRLEVPFRELLVKLPNDRQEDEDGDMDYGREELPQWGRVLQQAAQDAFDTIVNGLGRSPRVLKAVARVEGRFRGALYKKISEGGVYESEE